MSIVQLAHSIVNDLELTSWSCAHLVMEAEPHGWWPMGDSGIWRTGVKHSNINAKLWHHPPVQKEERFSNWGTLCLSLKVFTSWGTCKHSLSGVGAFLWSASTSNASSWVVFIYLSVWSHCKLSNSPCTATCLSGSGGKYRHFSQSGLVPQPRYVLFANTLGDVSPDDSLVSHIFKTVFKALFKTYSQLCSECAIQGYIQGALFKVFY